MDLKCETCKFWEEGRSEIPSVGLCYRYAPRPEIIHPVEGPEFMDAIWPRTKDKEWYGEWTAKVEIEVED